MSPNSHQNVHLKKHYEKKLNSEKNSAFSIYVFDHQKDSENIYLLDVRTIPTTWETISTNEMQ